MASLGDYQKTAAQLMSSLAAHVSRYEHAPRQQSAEWFAAKSTCIGGSELASLLGINPYSSRSKLLARKAGLETFSSVGVACWWGTMMEPVSENLVTAMFGHPVIGTDIHIRAETLPGHANSPDGYTVVPFTQLPGGSWQLCTDAEKAFADGQRVIPVPVLIELKAPYRRHLKNSVPAYYVPQVLSGLALSPPAATGLYVEIIYRVCSFAQHEEHSADYSTNYHNKDIRAKTTSPPWDKPVALGVTAFYAPRIGTRSARGVCISMDQKGADQLCIALLSQTCGMSFKPADIGAEFVDIGEVADTDPATFDALLGFVNSGEVTIRHSSPALVKKGGECQPALAKFMQQTEAAKPPENYYLLGYMPWKVFDVGCHQIQKDPKYLETLRPNIESFMQDLETITSAPNPAVAFTLLTTQPQKDAERAVNQSNLQTLFDMFTGPKT